MYHDLLPVVSPDIGGPLQKELPENDKAYIGEQLTRIADINPCVASFISTFCLESEDIAGCALCGIMVYRLLESQAEVDRMKDSFKFDPNE